MVSTPPTLPRKLTVLLAGFRWQLSKAATRDEQRDLHRKALAKLESLCRLWMPGADFAAYGAVRAAMNQALEKAGCSCSHVPFECAAQRSAAARPRWSPPRQRVPSTGRTT